MSVLGPEDEALLRGARAGIDATSDDQARVKRRLFAQLGIGAATGGSAIATSTGASASAATTAVARASVVTKILVAGVFVGLVSGGAFVATHAQTRSNVAPSSAAAVPVNPTLPQPSADRTPSIANSASSSAPVDTSLPSLLTTSRIVDAPAHRVSSPTSDTSPASDRAAMADRAASINVTNPAPLSPETVSTTSGNLTASAATATTPIPAGPATVDAEAALLRSADTELKAGRADHALALLDQHAAQFPNGVLSEERDAERVLVLCALGRKQEARDAAATFLSARPRSPQAARIRASCGGRN